MPDPIRHRRGTRTPKERTGCLSSPERQTISPDLAAVTAVKSGDQGAMAELYDRYSSVVYAVALRVLGNTMAAEDVLQEVFLQLWRNPNAFDPERGRLASWLAVIARNRAIDALRKRPQEEDIDELPISTGVDMEGETAQRIAVDIVRRVLGQLPQDQ